MHVHGARLMTTLALRGHAGYGGAALEVRCRRVGRKHDWCIGAAVRQEIMMPDALTDWRSNTDALQRRTRPCRRDCDDGRMQ